MNISDLEKKQNAGYSFIETISVLAVSALFAAGVCFSAIKLIENAKVTQTRQQVAAYKSALESYYIDCGCFPTSQQGLEALWDKPVLNPVPKNWNGPYIDRCVQRDSWGNSFIYLSSKSAQFPNEVRGKLPFVIMSYGADGQKGGSGKDADVVSWK